MTQPILIRGGDAYLHEYNDIARRDVLLREGQIAAIGPSLPAPDGCQVIDASGCLVTPGLIDFHMHAFRYGHFLSVDADDVAWRTGVTTFVDAGSAGSLHFMAFRDYVIRQSRSTILAFLHISAIGQTTDGCAGLDFPEADDDRMLHLASALEVIRRNRDIIVGIKVRAYTGMPSLLALARARELADQVGLPIMVHTAAAPPTFTQVVSYLKTGDIITHPYHGGATTILGHDGKVLPEYWAARERGIEVDLGADRFHCSLPIMKACFEQGFFPDYISSDLAQTNINSVAFDLPTTIDKALACGMPLNEALRCVTSAPATKLGRLGVIGVLAEGADADVAVFRFEPGASVLEDFFGNRMTVEQRLRNVVTIKRGIAMTSPGRQTEVLDCLRRANPWVQ
jgi:dihydroorotase